MHHRCDDSSFCVASSDIIQHSICLCKRHDWHCNVTADKDVYRLEA